MPPARTGVAHYSSMILPRFPEVDGPPIYHLGNNPFHEEIYRMTIFDALTKVHNKRYLIDFLEREKAEFITSELALNVSPANTGAMNCIPA